MRVKQEKHYRISDIEFENQFEEGVLDEALFTHEAHLRLAWIHITKYGITKAVNNIRFQIRNYTKILGEEDIYNETLTVASLYIVESYIQNSQSKDFSGFIKEFPELKSNFKELIQKHYSFDVFSSIKAKKEFIEPDAIPFIQV